MRHMRLYLGNKNYSSWSMRAGLLLAHAGIPYEEVILSFGDLGPDSRFRHEIVRVSAAARVPVLVDGDVVVWDSLAIAEYVAELAPQKQLWPSDRAIRARARSLCAEMHSGFTEIRTLFPMNIEMHAPEIGPRVLAERPEAQRELARLDAILAGELARSAGPMLFGAAFGIADTYFAPIASRIRSYGLPVSDASAAWVERVHQQPAMQAWVRDALAEHDWVAFNEPYRQKSLSANG
jgi:glutathione S-transferase